MRQIILRGVTLWDFIENAFLWLRFQVYLALGIRLTNNPEPSGKWIETFFDDFVTKSWSNSADTKWIIGEAWGTHYPDSIAYFGPPIIAMCSLADFSVHHNPKVIDGQIIPFEASYLCTNFSFRQQYGRFECRCTLPDSHGAWPAFWLWGPTWPPEIDVYEAWGGEIGAGVKIQIPNIHWGQSPNNDDLYKWPIRIEKSNVNAFHHFAVEWSRNKIEFFTDGVKVFRFSRLDVLDKWYNAADVKMWMVISAGVDKRYVRPDETEYHSSFFVDYVRASKKISPNVV